MIRQKAPYLKARTNLSEAHNLRQRVAPLWSCLDLERPNNSREQFHTQPIEGILHSKPLHDIRSFVVFRLRRVVLENGFNLEPHFEINITLFHEGLSDLLVGEMYSLLPTQVREPFS